MGAKHCAAVSFLVVLLTGCSGRSERYADDVVFEGTLAEACGEDCLFWSETDDERSVQGTDGLRVYIEPSFGAFDYRFEIVPQPQGCITIWPDEEFARDKNYCAHYLVRMRKQASQMVSLVQQRSSRISVSFCPRRMRESCLEFRTGLRRLGAVVALALLMERA